MIKIKLTQRQTATVDNRDAHLKQFKWYAARFGLSFYAVRKWKTPEGKEGRQRLHHLVLGISRLPRQFNVCADHINGNTLDNRRSNLRIVSRRANNQNTEKHRNGHLTGVRFYKAHRLSKPWMARIKINGVEKHLGFFKTAEEASEVYWKACPEWMNAGTIGTKESIRI